MTSTLQRPLFLALTALLASAPGVSARQTTVEGALQLGWEATRGSDIDVDTHTTGVAVVGNRIIAVGTTAGSGGDFLVRSSSTQTGGEVWTAVYSNTPSSNESARTVVATTARVLVGGTTQEPGEAGPRGLVVGFDAVTGEVSWEWTFGSATTDKNQGVLDMVLSADGSVLFVLAQFDDQIFGNFTSDAAYALSTTTGAVLWQRSLGEIRRGQGLRLSPDGQVVGVLGCDDYYGPFGGVDSDARAAGLDAGNGAVLWGQLVEADLAFDEGLNELAFSSDSSTLVAVGNLESDVALGLNTQTGARLWSTDLAGAPLTDVRIDSSGRATAAGADVATATVAQFDVASGLVLWALSEPSTGPVVGFELDEPGQQALVVYRSGFSFDSEDWRVEARALDLGTLLASRSVGVGDGFGDAAVGSALDPSRNELWVGSRAESLAGIETVEQTRLSLGNLQPVETLVLAAMEPGDDRIRDAGLSPDGATVFSAGQVGEYFGSALPGGFGNQGGWVTAHDAGSGALQWELELPGYATSDVLESASDPSRVFVGGRGGGGLAELRALDAQDGSALWAVELDDSTLGTGDVTAIQSTPGSGRLIVAHETKAAFAQKRYYVTSVDALTGQELWRYEALGTTVSEASLMQLTPAGDSALLVLPQGGRSRVDAVNTADGSLAWSVLLDSDQGNPQLFSDRVRALDISPDGARGYLTGEASSFPPLLLAPFTVCFDVLSGQQLWAEATPIGMPAALTARRVRVSQDGATVYSMASGRYGFDPQDYELKFEARDAITGQSIWNESVLTFAELSGNGEALETTLDGGLLLYSAIVGPTGDAYVGALSAATGDPVAEINTPGSDVGFDQSNTLLLAPDGRRMFVGSRVAPGQALQRDLLLQEFELPSLSAAPASVSIAAGGTQTFALAAGVERAGEFALLLGTTAGVDPGVPLGQGLVLPLQPSGYTTFTFTKINQPPLMNTFSVLDSAGSSTAALVVPPATFPSFIGATLHHAWVSLDANGMPTAVSNPVALELLP